MLFNKQGTAYKDLKIFVKRGLSWVELDQQRVWGKINGVWKRGTRKIVRMNLDPAVVTVYWDTDLWESLGRPTNDLDVQIYVGKNAILAQSFIPSPEAQAAYETYRLSLPAASRPAAYIPSAAALNLAGGWGLNTTFDVQVAGLVIGCSGYGAEPVEITKKVQPNVVAAGSGPNLSVGKSTEYMVDAAYIMIQESTDYYAQAYGSYTFSDGYIDGFFEKGKKGGRGGAALRANRATKVTFIKNSDGTYGMIAGGGGGGGSLGAFWRRYYGGIYLIMADTSNIHSGEVPNYGGTTFYRYQPELVADDTFTKQWALSGWGGSMGAGATLVLGLGPNCPLTLQTYSGSSANAQHADFKIVNKSGRLAPPWPRKAANRFGTDGLEGHWYVWSSNGGRNYDFVANAKKNHPAKSVSGRSAGSGHADGAIVHYGTSAEIRASGKVLSNDFISAALSPVVAATVATGMTRYSAYAARTGAPQLKMYERATSTKKFKGGTPQGAFVPFTSATVYQVIYSTRYQFPLHYTRQKNEGDDLTETSLTGGVGGLLGKAGTAAVLDYAGSSLSWSTSQCAGYSHFPVKQDAAGNKLAGDGGDAGPAVIGSEYVTFAGTQNTTGDLKSLTGTVIPFE